MKRPGLDCCEMDNLLPLGEFVALAYTLFQNGAKYTILCLYVNWPSLPRFKAKMLLNSAQMLSRQRGPINMKTKE